MSLASLSIKRPVFITCVVLTLIVVGWMSFKRLPIDLFPNVDFPIVMVLTPYPGAGPKEIETSISKVLEEEFSNVSGIKSLRSINQEGLSRVVAEFSLEVDVKYAEQQIRDRVSSARRKFPTDVLESTIRRLSPSDQPIITLTVNADLDEDKLFDVADQVIRPQLEQIFQVGLVEIVGGRKREIQVDLDQKKLKKYEISASMVAGRLGATGENIPIGKYNFADKEVVYRALGEFTSLDDISSTIINFVGNETPVTLGQIASIKNGLVEESNKTYLNGEKSLMIMVFRQSGSNTIAVADAIEKKVAQINGEISSLAGKPEIHLVRNLAKMIKNNVLDVEESILIGIVLTVLVVFFFLASGRSTLITGLALPNSLLGAFILMHVAGFTINVMSLLALSLSVGLLVDDAIVVRENIFRHRAMGKSARKSALEGTLEVTLAVIATSLTVIAVFGPIGFLGGVVGQFFKQFGLTICFAMAISLFDALTIAPMMSAYFGGAAHHISSKGIYGHTVGAVLRGFEKFQQLLEFLYEKTLRLTLKIPLLVLLLALGFFVFSIFLTKYVPKTFLPPQDYGEFSVAIDMPPGTSLEKMDQVADSVDKTIRGNKEVETTLLTVGDREGKPNVAELFVNLVPRDQRGYNTSEFKEFLRTQLKSFAYANPVVKDIDMIGGGIRPFNVNIIGDDLTKIEEISQDLLQRLKDHPALLDVDTSHRPGKPEVQFIIDRDRAEKFGVSPNIAGMELRTLVAGVTPAVYREKGQEYDIRVRLTKDQRDLSLGFENTFVPNINNRLVRLENISQKIETTGPATINRQDRGRYIQIQADIAPNGPGLSAAMADVKKIFAEDITLPDGYRYAFVGQAENFKELIEGMIMAVFLSVIFIYFVLASLYDSFVTPFTIMLVLPLAISGAIIALLVTQKSLDLNSMIGCILLLGIATKNSILLVDYANQKVAEGMARNDAILEAGKVRLRPILMTTVALIAGMLPIAIGLNEASKQRTSMGVAVIGGLISSTVLSLIVVPAAYAYIDRFRAWAAKFLGRIFLSADTE